MGYFSSFSLVFSNRKYAAAFALLFLLFLPLYLVFTDIVLLEPIGFNPVLKLPEAILLVLVAFFASLGIALASYHIFELGALASMKSAGAGSALGLFATACPVCQPIWLIWLGLGAASAFLADYSIYIIAASLLLLLYSVHSSLKGIEGCAIPKKH